MFKFIDSIITVGILKKQLTSYNPMRPYDDSYYSYKITGETIDILVHFHYREDIHDKYLFSYNTTTNDFTMTPNDLGIHKGSQSYRSLQKALKFASEVILKTASFIAKVNESRKECAKLIDPRHQRASGSSSDSYGRSRSGHSKHNDGCNPSIRDAVYSVSDDSSSRGSSRDRDSD